MAETSSTSASADAVWTHRSESIGEEIKAAFEAAEDAIKTLPDCDALGVRLTPLLEQCRSAMTRERQHRGNRPTLGFKKRDLVDNLVKFDSRTLRTSAYEAIDRLLDLTWQPMSRLERKHKQREDPEYRRIERDRDVERKRMRSYEKDLTSLDRAIDVLSPTPGKSSSTDLEDWANSVLALDETPAAGAGWEATSSRTGDSDVQRVHLPGILSVPPSPPMMEIAVPKLREKVGKHLPVYITGAVALGMSMAVQLQLPWYGQVSSPEN